MAELDPMMLSHLPGSSTRCCTLYNCCLSAEVSNRGRPARIAEGSGTDQLERGRPQAVVGHKYGRNIRGDQSARTVDAGLQRVLMRIQIKDQDIAVSGGNQGIYPLAVGFEQNLDIFTEGRRKKWLQRAVFGIESNSCHGRAVI